MCKMEIFNLIQFHRSVRTAFTATKYYKKLLLVSLGQFQTVVVNKRYSYQWNHKRRADVNGDLPNTLKYYLGTPCFDHAQSVPEIQEKKNADSMKLLLNTIGSASVCSTLVLEDPSVHPTSVSALGSLRDADYHSEAMLTTAPFRNPRSRF